MEYRDKGVREQRNRQEVAKEYYNHRYKANNILERLDIQDNWLRDIGF